MLLFSLYHLSAVWRTRKHVGLVVFCNLLLDGNIQNVLVLVQIFKAAPDCIKKKPVALWRVHAEFTSLLTVSSEHIVPACVCVFRFLPVWKYSPFPLTWSGIVYILAAFQRPFFEKILGVSSRAQQPDENTADIRFFCSSGLFLTFQKAQRPLGDIIQHSWILLVK